MTPTRIVIDTDTGVDDAIALVLAANSPELDVVGLTTVAGNAEVAECTRNVLLLSGHLWSCSPPIASGASAPLDVALTTAPEVHGDDGLGGERGTLPQPAMAPEDVPAHEFLVELARACRAASPPERISPEATTLVATGPLTNLALALRLDPESLSAFERIIVMGGALRVPGNTGPYAEFNFYVDPAAADLVLRSGLDVTVVPLDATTAVELPRGVLELLPGWSDALATSAAWRAGAGTSSTVDRVADGAGLLPCIVARALDHYIRFQRGESGLDAGYMHDPTALASAFAPGLLDTTDMPLRVVAGGPERGRSVEAHDGRPPVKVALNADSASILTLLSERVLNPLFG